MAEEEFVRLMREESPTRAPRAEEIRATNPALAPRRAHSVDWPNGCCRLAWKDRKPFPRYASGPPLPSTLSA